MFSICHMLYLSLNAWSPSLVYSRLNTFTTVTYTLHRLVQCVRPKYLVAQRHMSFRTYVYHNWFYLYPLPCLFVVFKVSTGIDKLDINLVLVACVVDCVGQFVFLQNSHWRHPLHAPCGSGEKAWPPCSFLNKEPSKPTVWLPCSGHVQEQKRVEGPPY